MIVELLSSVVRDLLIFSLFLYFFRYRFFVESVNKILRLTILVLIVSAGVLVGTIRLAPKVVKGLVKGVGTVFLAVILGAVYLLTWVVPSIGGRIQRIRYWIDDGLIVSHFDSEARRLRGILVEIAAESDDREIEFDDPERYRTELSEVKEDAKTRLEDGETALSILLGAVLITAKVAGIQIFEIRLYGIPASLLVETWLLVIAVSIIYRVSIMDFLAYSPNHEFKSVKEMDTALAYQKAVCIVSVVQGLTLVMIFVYSVSNVRTSIVKSVLRNVYSDGMAARDWLPMAWRMLRENDEEDGSDG
ncbi:hypothetical protein [Haloarchaeobius sp. HRN-SO-5]|uniref:hypothetical protein n=1 Tax=Haloarchaeobius sp. HRN-SO-5 TaxID=3446118 RepID=UPI003EBED28D